MKKMFPILKILIIQRKQLLIRPTETKIKILKKIKLHSQIRKYLNHKYLYHSGSGPNGYT